jgi:hypothetical protein
MATQFQLKETFEMCLVIQRFLNYHPEPLNCKFSLPTILVFQMGGLEMVSRRNNMLISCLITPRCKAKTLYCNKIR